MNIALTETRSGHRAPVRRTVPVSPGSSAVLVATAAAADGGAAALQPWEGETLLARLAGQFASLGIERVHVLTRPAWREAIARRGRDVQVHAGESPADDLRAIAAIAAGAGGPLVVAYADIVTQREVLAGLLAEPRIRTGVLTTGGSAARPFGFKTRSNRGRIVSAGSPYHAVRRPTGTFLGVLKVAPADRPGVAPVAEQLAALVEPGAARRLAGGARLQGRPLAPHARAVRARPRARRAAARPRGARRRHARRPRTPPSSSAGARSRPTTSPRCCSSASSAPACTSAPRGCARCSGPAPARRPRSSAPRAEILEHDEDRELLNSAVKGADGFFTTFFVSTYSKYIARWAARRGLTPNQVTMFSIAVGVRRRGLLRLRRALEHGRWAGCSLYFAFVFDCVDGQLARYTRQFSKLGAWLDSIFDRTKEYVVFAGLAIGASRTGDPVWVLAGAALALQTSRHAIDFSFPASQHQAIAAAPQPPIENPFDGPRPASRLTEPVETEEVEEEDVRAPVAAARRRR